MHIFFKNKCHSVLWLASLLGWLVALSAVPAAAQVVNKCLITVKGGAILYSQGDIQNLPNGDLNNAGTVETEANINNFPNGTMRGSGTYKLKKNWVNVGNYTANNAKIYFLGNTESLLMSGGKDLNAIYIQKTNGADVRLNGDVQLKSVYFTSNNSHLLLDTSDLVIKSGGIISGATKLRHVVTGNNGGLRYNQIGSTAKLFPISADQQTYNPLTVSQLGTVDDIWVRCLPEMYMHGDSGNALLNTVAASWQVKESVEGGSNLNLTTEWAGTDEKGTFNRQFCAVTFYDTLLHKWDLVEPMLGAAQGNNPYQRTRLNVSKTGYFGVASTLPMNAPIPSFIRKPIERDTASLLSVYPSPATTKIDISHQIDSIASLDIYDTKGSIVARLDPTLNHQNLPIESWKPGLYVLLAVDQNGKILKKAWVKMD